MTSYTGTTNIYNSWTEYQDTGANVSSDVFRILLTTSTYTPNQATHTVLADITNEVSGSGYARQALTVTVSRTAAVRKFTFSSPVFTATGGSIVARYWVIFDDTVATPTKPLVAYGLIDSTDANVTTTDTNTLTFSPNASGLYTVTRS